MRVQQEPLDWRDELRRLVKDGEELCHGGCGDLATVLRLYGRRSGAFCRGCWGEIAYGNVPPLDKPKGLRRLRDPRRG